MAKTNRIRRKKKSPRRARPFTPQSDRVAYTRHQRCSEDKAIVALFKHRIECGLSDAEDEKHWVSVALSEDGTIAHLYTECGVDNDTMDTLERLECDSCASVALGIREVIKSGDSYTSNLGRTIPDLLERALVGPVRQAIVKRTKRRYLREAQDLNRTWGVREDVLDERVGRATGLSPITFRVKCHQETGLIDRVVSNGCTLASMTQERTWEMATERQLENWYSTFEDMGSCPVCLNSYTNMKQHTRTKKHRNNCRLAMFKALPVVTPRKAQKKWLKK